MKLNAIMTLIWKWEILFLLRGGWQISDSIFLEVWDVDTIVTQDGVERKRIYLRNTHSYGSWVEGIGSDDWIFVYPSYAGGWLDAGYYVSCHFQEEAPIWNPFTNGEFCDFDVLTSTTEIKSTFNFYPNPADTKLTFHFPDAKTRPWQLFNINGKVVKSGTFYSNKEQIQLQELADGIYFLRTDGHQMKKLLIDHRK